MRDANATYHASLQNADSVLRLWNDHTVRYNSADLARAAVPVKGAMASDPLRFLKIFSDPQSCKPSRRDLPDVNSYSWSDIERTFFPRILGRPIQLDDRTWQPPFPWRDARPEDFCVSFTYNTNAFYRIFRDLSIAQRIPAPDVDNLVTDACHVLGALYRARGYFLLRTINNNLNMFFISRVVEFLVGKSRYDIEQQELSSTSRSLEVALNLAHSTASYSLIEKMGVAIGKGVSFVESRLKSRQLQPHDLSEVQDRSHAYHDQRFAIDHRDRLIRMIDQAGRSKGFFTLCAILDDTTESVDDLLWLQDLLEAFPFTTVSLLVNTAQISINFASSMLPRVLNSSHFRLLASEAGKRLLVHETHCPLISFQTNYLTNSALGVIAHSDAVYVKGANFFETCQIRDKDTFHAFVVYGPVSRRLTGLQDFDAVFAHIPAGTVGYSALRGLREVVTLKSQISHN